MRWKDMRREWPTLEAYAKDHTAFEVATSRALFVSGVVAAGWLVSSLMGLTPWSWFLWGPRCGSLAACRVCGFDSLEEGQMSSRS